MAWWTTYDIRQIIELRCDKCDAIHTIYADNVICYILGLLQGDPMDGWQNINEKIYCPKCVEGGAPTMTHDIINPSGIAWNDVLPPKLKALREHISEDGIALYDEIISDVSSMNCEISVQLLKIEQLHRHVHSLERIVVDTARAHVAFHDTCDAIYKNKKIALSPEDYEDDVG